MKKRSVLLAALLAAAALTGAAFAAGGDSADPLISLDYLQSVFSAKVDAAAGAFVPFKLVLPLKTPIPVNFNK